MIKQEIDNHMLKINNETNNLVGSPSLSPSSYQGLIDELRIYSRELTKTEICSLFHLWYYLVNNPSRFNTKDYNFCRMHHFQWIFLFFFSQILCFALRWVYNSIFYLILLWKVDSTTNISTCMENEIIHEFF
jgi:hypothetical protein